MLVSCPSLRSKSSQDEFVHSGGPVHGHRKTNKKYAYEKGETSSSVVVWQFLMVLVQSHRYSRHLLVIHTVQTFGEA